MQENFNVVKYASMLYRQCNRFYDKKLAQYHIGSGQVFPLVYIYEHDGTGMYEIVQKGCFDKGTVTKGIQKLEEQGYIRLEADAVDRRIRRLYITPAARPIIECLYEIRQQWIEILMNGLVETERTQAEYLLRRMAENAWHCMSDKELDKE